MSSIVGLQMARLSMTQLEMRVYKPVRPITMCAATPIESPHIIDSKRLVTHSNGQSAHESMDVEPTKAA
jgi:hypothetical protein